MKPLNKAERWYGFLEIIYTGSSYHALALHHIDYGFLSQTDVDPARMEELDAYIDKLWHFPPEVSYE